MFSAKIKTPAQTLFFVCFFLLKSYFPCLPLLSSSSTVVLLLSDDSWRQEAESYTQFANRKYFLANTHITLVIKFLEINLPFVSYHLNIFFLFLFIRSQVLRRPINTSWLSKSSPLGIIDLSGSLAFRRAMGSCMRYELQVVHDSSLEIFCCNTAVLSKVSWVVDL